MILFFAVHPTQIGDKNSDISIVSRDGGLEQKESGDTDGNWLQQEDRSSYGMDLGMYIIYI